MDGEVQERSPRGSLLEESDTKGRRERTAATSSPTIRSLVDSELVPVSGCGVSTGSAISY